MQGIDYRKLNRYTMDDTFKMCMENEILREAVSNSVENEYVVYAEDDLDVSPQKNDAMEVIVTKNRTYQAAEKYKGKKICCLDFANNHSIGGAPWSAGAQEESMCRISTLYPCLYAQKEEFYERHKEQFGKGQIDDMGNDDLIYIPDVVVMKSDGSLPELRDQKDWFKTDVIVSAAPQLGWISYDLEDYKRIMTSRIKRILDVAEKEKVQVLILGAFGCGAFCNPPKVVSKIFADLIVDYSFETVEFAVHCRNNQENYETFKETLGKEN